jgi:hypothetical protein
MLAAAITAAAALPAVSLPHPRKPGRALTQAWGSQLDVKVVHRGIAGEIDDQKVAAYVAKYASKGTEDIGGVPRRIESAAELDDWHVTPHVRQLITACWQLGKRDDYQPLRLARWAHQLGTAATSPPAPAGTPSPCNRGGPNAAKPAPHGPASSTDSPNSPASSPANGTTPAPDSPPLNHPPKIGPKVSISLSRGSPLRGLPKHSVNPLP